MENLKKLAKGNGMFFSDLNESIELGKNWILYSGIQNMEEDSKFYGSISSWYDADRKAYAFAYPEATGYAITFFLFLNKIEKNEEYVLRAKTAAEWILNHAFDRSTKEIRHKFFYQPSMIASKYSYAFDNGIILSGFINLYRETGDILYLNSAKEIANRLIQNMHSEEGYFYSHYDMEARRKLVSEDKWSTQSGPHHAKIAISMIRLFEITGEKKYRESALKICDWTMNQQLEEGRFITNYADGSTTLHPHCYALEGLLYAGLYFKKDKMLKSVKKGIQWLLKQQLETGGIPAECNNGSSIYSERGDSVAQTIRLVSMAIKRKIIGKEYSLPLSKMINRLLEFQCKDTSMSQSQRGGFYFRTNGDGSMPNHINSWTSMFSIQALNMFIELYKRREGIEPNFLL